MAGINKSWGVCGWQKVGLERVNAICPYFDSKKGDVEIFKRVIFHGPEFFSNS